MPLEPRTPTATAAVEDYAKAIYALSHDGRDTVSTTALADRLNVTAGSVSAMIKKLDERGLVERTRERTAAREDGAEAERQRENVNRGEQRGDDHDERSGHVRQLHGCFDGVVAVCGVGVSGGAQHSGHPMS
jgi:DNA-binding Lrp family transcriptional regulator